jgi:cytochrome c-type biogenesis protein CcmH
LVLVGVAVAALVVGTHRSSPRPTVAQQTTHIASLVRCPVCEGQSAAQSDAPASVQIRAQIQRELIAGEHQGQILSGLVDAYGPGILEQPQARGINLVVWVLPVAAVVIAVAGLGVAFARWRPRAARNTLSEADRALVAAALGEPEEAPGASGMGGLRASSESSGAVGAVGDGVSASPTPSGVSAPAGETGPSLDVGDADPAWPSGSAVPPAAAPASDRGGRVG